MPLDRAAARCGRGRAGRAGGLWVRRRQRPASSRSTTPGRLSSSASRPWCAATTRGISWSTPTAEPVRCTPSLSPRSWGSKGVVVPLGNGASTLSAFGCSTSNLVLDIEKEQIFFTPFPAAELKAVDRRAGEAGHGIRWERWARRADEVEIERFGLMRYSGQWLHSLVVRIPPGELTDEALQTVVGRLPVDLRQSLRPRRRAGLPGSRAVHRAGARGRPPAPTGAGRAGRASRGPSPRPG